MVAGRKGPSVKKQTRLAGLKSFTYQVFRPAMLDNSVAGGSESRKKLLRAGVFQLGGAVALACPGINPQAQAAMPTAGGPSAQADWKPAGRLTSRIHPASLLEPDASTSGSSQTKFVSIVQFLVSH